MLRRNYAHVEVFLMIKQANAPLVAYLSIFVAWYGLFRVQVMLGE